MRFLSVLLISLFMMNVADIPFEALQGTQARSCCCKAGTICRCSGMCPMKRMKEAQAAEKHGHCALQTKAAAKTIKKALKKAEASGAPLFKSFGCGSSEEHKAAPTYSRDFISAPQSHWFGGTGPQFFLRHSPQTELPQIFYPIERPPQIPLFSL